MICGIVFDFDMTLIDTSYSMEYCVNLMLDHFRLPRITRTRLMDIIGLCTPLFFAAAVGSEDPKYVKYYIDNCRKHEIELARPFPGALEALLQLKKLGIKIGTASNRNSPDRMLIASGLKPLMDCSVGALDVPEPKPAPYMLWKALELMGIPREQGMYVGDAEVDVSAAAHAGIKGLGVCTSTTSERLQTAGAWKVCSTIAEIPALLEKEGQLP